MRTAEVKIKVTEGKVRDGVRKKIPGQSWLHDDSLWQISVIRGKKGWTGGGQRQKNNNDGGKEGKGVGRWRCEQEEREDPNACELKRIKGFYTSREGEKEMCGGDDEWVIEDGRRQKDASKRMQQWWWC